MTIVITTHRIPDPVMAIAIQPHGEVSSHNAHMLRDRVTAVLAATKPRRIVVDLSAVPSIDDAGLAALRSGRDTAAAHEANLVVVDPNLTVRGRLQHHGLNDLVDRSLAGSRTG